MKKNKRWFGTDIFFWILFSVYFIVTLLLFHRQTVCYGGKYPSDILPYLDEIQGISSGFDYPYPVMFWIARLLMFFTTPAHAMSLAVGGLNALTVVGLKFYFDKKLPIGQKGFRQISTLLVFGTLLVSMIFPLQYLGHYVDYVKGSPDYLYRYLGVFSPNPFHNATYLAARPFAVVVFFLMTDILEEYEENTKWLNWKYVIFGALLLVATMAKPSFTFVFVGTSGIIMLYRLLRSRGKNFKASFQLGIYFIPTFLDLLYQYRDVFVGSTARGEEKGIGVGFLVAWGDSTDNVPVSILLAVAFPLAVLLFQGRGLLKDKCLRFAGQLFLVSLLMFMFLYEKGFRKEHLNFAWGYMYGMFFLFATSLLTLARETKNRKQPLWQLLIQWLLFALHLVCGLDYLRVLLCGGWFY